MKPVLFIGPTLYGLSAHVTAAFDLRPPAQCGDILKALQDGVRQIGLIDGVFGDCRSVWHKEILFALSQGASISGAASMRALRAAECDLYGMIGIGEIYMDFKNGRRTADADVAVLHGPQELGFMPLTVALVDAEATILRLENVSAISASEAEALLRATGHLRFRHRPWAALCATSDFSNEQTERIKVVSRGHFVSRKTTDALALIDFMTDSGYADRQKGIKSTPARTIYLDRLLHACRLTLS